MLLLSMAGMECLRCFVVCFEKVIFSEHSVVTVYCSSFKQASSRAMTPSALTVWSQAVNLGSCQRFRVLVVSWSLTLRAQKTV